MAAVAAEEALKLALEEEDAADTRVFGLPEDDVARLKDHDSFREGGRLAMPGTY